MRDIFQKLVFLESIFWYLYFPLLNCPDQDCFSQRGSLRQPGELWPVVQAISTGLILYQLGMYFLSWSHLLLCTLGTRMLPSFSYRATRGLCKGSGNGLGGVAIQQEFGWACPAVSQLCAKTWYPQDSMSEIPRPWGRVGGSFEWLFSKYVYSFAHLFIH